MASFMNANASFAEIDSSLAGENLKRRAFKEERSTDNRKIMTRVERKCSARPLSTDLFRPVSLISHSRAKDDQNDFCSVLSCSDTAPRVPGVETSCVHCIHRTRIYRLLSFRIFRSRLFSKRMTLLSPQTGSINLSSRMAGRGVMPRSPQRCAYKRP